MTIHQTFGQRAAGETGESDTFDFVLSDETVDRYGDIIVASGWVLSNFKKNPVALYGHQGDRLPIGRWENVRVIGKQLIGTLRLATVGTSGFIDAIRELIKQRILNAVSVGFRHLKAEPLDPEKPFRGQRYLRSELMEASVVSVPANPNAVIQRALDPFPADVRNLLLAATGQQQDRTRPGFIAKSGNLHPIPGAKPMTKLSELIQDDRDELIALNDEQAQYREKIKDGIELTEQEMAEFERLEGEIGVVEKRLNLRQTTEKRIGAEAVTRQPPSTQQQNLPGVVQQGPTERMWAKARDAKERPMDTLVRLAVLHLKAHVERKPVDMMLREVYPDRSDMDAVIKAVTNPAATTVAGWAAELVDTAVLDFMEALRPESVYAQLAAKGVRFSFGRNGSVKIPRRNASTGAGAAPDLRGAFVGEGQPIPVRRGSFGSVSLVPHKMGVISTFTREMAQQSTPQIEELIRQGIIEDTAVAVDFALLDAVAGDAIRPAGLMNGVTPLTGTAGGGIAAITGDLAQLLAPFNAANAASGIVFLINPAKVFALQWVSTAVGIYPFRDEANAGRIGGYPFIVSTNVAPTDLIAVRYTDFVSSVADTPEWDISDTATIHEDDGSYPADQAMRPGTSTVLPLATGTSGAGALTAAPVRSLWQTASIGIRMLLGMDWAMRRAGMVQKVAGITW